MADEHIPGSGERTKVAAATGTSIAVAIMGLGAVTLAIIALANVLPVFLLSIGVIATGTALLFEGGTLSGRFYRLGATETTGRRMRRGGMIFMFLLGVAVIALGILALIGVASRYLVPAAVILLGIGLILGSNVSARIGWMETNPTAAPHETEFFTFGIRSFLGLAVLVLGILALIGVQPLVLSLVALMFVGFVQFLNSTAETGMFSFSRR